MTDTETPLPLAPGPDELPPPKPSREGRGMRVLVAALGAGLLFGPWLAYATGARSDPVPGENRALASAPTKWDGFNTFGELTQWASDRFPLRDVAIRDNKRLINDILGENPSYFGSSDNQPVLVGTDGWLYLMDDFNEDCKPGVPLTTVIAGVERLNQMLTASGRRFVLTVPPDKSTADPQNLPASFELKQCSLDGKATRWKALSSLPIPGYVDMLSKVKALEKSQGDTPQYLPYDTHWDENAENVFVESVAKELDPNLLKDTSIQAGGYYTQQGDLPILLNGSSPNYKFQATYLVRQGVTYKTTDDQFVPGTLGKDAYNITHYTATSTKAPLFTPKTTWIGDSFTQRVLGGDDGSDGKIQPFFADLTRVPELTKAVAAQGPMAPNLYAQAQAAMIQSIVDSKVTVLELVERTFAGASGCGSMWQTQSCVKGEPDFLDRLQAALDAAPKQ